MGKTKQLLIFPFGGNAKEAFMIIRNAGGARPEWKVRGFVDDNLKKRGSAYDGIEVFGRQALKDKASCYVLAVPGNPDNHLERRDIIESLGIDKKRFANVIHGSVFIAGDARVGYNNLIMPNVVIGAGARIGNHCVILPNTVISHDSIVEDFVCIGANVTVSGHCRIGTSSYIGSGTKIKDHLSVGQGALAGLGSNVIADVRSFSVVAGNPARELKVKVKK